MPTKKTAASTATAKSATKTAATKTTTAKKTAAKSVSAAKKTAAKSEVASVEVKTEAKPVGERKKGVLFVASEAFPYAGTGGLGEVIGSLPKSLNKLGKYDARVILPLYESVSAEVRAKMQYLGNIYVPLAWRMQYCGLFRLEEDGTVYYFVDNEYYFKRNSLYGYGDDGERFAFLSRAVLELIPML
ncbi:MAG: glycogen/starch synthase, partial [Candidatus Neoclostridium sp.]